VIWFLNAFVAGFHERITIYRVLKWRVNGITVQEYLVTGKLLLAFASTFILDFGPRGTHDNIILSHDSD
jgi:hypothetical protein